MKASSEPRIPGPRVLGLLPWILPLAMATVAAWASPRIPEGPWPRSAAVIALVAGVLVGSIGGVRALLAPGAKRVSQLVIPWAIVAIGCGLNLGPLLSSGQLGAGLAVAVCAMLIAFGAALLSCRLLGLDRRAALLLGTGTAVCGNSAIMAVAPIVEPRDEELGLSIGVINLLGVAMLFALPPVGQSFGVDGDRGGVLAGLTVHAVPQAIATGEAFGPSAIEWATLYKLLRVAMLVPVTLILSFLLSRRESGKGGSRALVPWYVVAFVVAAIARGAGTLDGEFSIGGTEQPLWSWAKSGGRFALAVALAAIGMGIDVGKLMRVGPKVLLAGLITVATMVAGTLPMIIWWL